MDFDIQLRWGFYRNPKDLNQLREANIGMVGDGLTSLNIQVSPSEPFAEDIAVQWSIDMVKEYASIKNIYSSIEYLDEELMWQPVDALPTRELEFAAGSSESLWLRILPLSNQDLDDFEVGSDEQLMHFTLMNTQDDLVAEKYIGLRKPPIVIHAGKGTTPMSQAFKNQLETIRPSDFIVEFPSPQYSAIFGDWAIVGPDMVGHGIGGAISARLEMANGIGGRRIFNHMILIGCPFNGTRLFPYLEGLKIRLVELTLQERRSNYLPRVIDKIPTWSEISDFRAELLRFALDPQSEHLPARDHLHSFQIQRPKHFVATKIDPERSNAFIALGLSGSRHDLVFPEGSDGLVDFQSMTTGLDEDSIKEIPYATYIDSESGIVHDEPIKMFGTDTRQLSSIEIAKLITNLLKDPEGKFGTYKAATRLSKMEWEAIYEAGRNVPVSRVIDLIAVSTESDQLPENQTDVEGVVVSYRTEVATEYPVAGEVYWFAEFFGPDGVTTEGVEVLPDPSDPAAVSIQISDAVVGDVVLYASYPTIHDQVVFANPEVIYTGLTDGLEVTGIEILPDEITLELGTDLVPDFYAQFSDGTALQRFLSSSEVDSVSSSDPAVIRIEDPLAWTAVGEGIAEITVQWSGFSDTVMLTVEDPYAPVDYQTWKMNRFTEEQLADESISGDQADADGDSLSTFAEYFTGGHPLLIDEGGFPRLELRPMGSETIPVLVFRVSRSFSGLDDLKIEQSQDLETWTPYFENLTPPDGGGLGVLEVSSYGAFHEVVLAADLQERQFFRFRGTLE